MMRNTIMGLIFLSLFACGKSDSGDEQNIVDASPLAGTFQQAPNGSARLQINSENLVVGTTLTIPSQIVGNETRLTPLFQQSLVFNATTGLYSTIGSFNDADGVFKNIEMRIRLYEQNKFLDVTLITPPDEALSTQAPGSSTALGGAPNQNGTPSQNGGTCDQDPNQNKPQPNCPVCPKTQVMYTFRFIRI